jgi:hypothetical protein
MLPIKELPDVGVVKLSILIHASIEYAPPFHHSRNVADGDETVA